MKKLILSVAFLGIGVLGFAQQKEAAKVDHAQKKAEHLQKLKDELNLTDAQVGQLKELYAEKADERKSQSDAKKIDRAQRMKDSEDEMKKILTPEQYKKFQDLRAKKMVERKEKLQERRVAPAAELK